MRIFSNSFFPRKLLFSNSLWVFMKCFFFFLPEKCLFLTYFWFHLRKRYIYIVLKKFPRNAQFFKAENFAMRA